jgi:DNA-binding GntR family transcriptional regulator
VAEGSMQVSAVAAPVRAQVLRNLREAILDRTFKPGQRLLERELCEMTGVSRTPVREALRQLESEGLVVMVPNRGPVVAQITLEEAADLYDVRGVLEALAARRFAMNATDDEVAELAASADRFARVVGEGDLTDIVKCKDEFYSIMLRGPRNAVVRSVLGSLHARIMFLRATSLRRPARSTETVAEIRKIVEAILERNPDSAWAWSKQHVERAADAAMEILRQNG